MKKIFLISMSVLLFTACNKTKDSQSSMAEKTGDTISEYKFVGGFPTPETSQKVYDELDLNRAVQAYRFFYPTVSGAGIFRGNQKIGIIPNKVFGTLVTKPIHVGYTLNSDTPYAPLLLDLSKGPMVIELPAGPLICVAMDINQIWIADLGLPGPAAGKGDKVVFLPPGYKAAVAAGYRVEHSPSNTMLVGVRSLPVNGDVPGALARIKTTKVYPLQARADWKEPTWIDLTPMPQDTSPLAWENNMQFWTILHETISSDVAIPSYHSMYGELAALGIVKGKPFTPDARMKGILEKAIKIANAQMRTESFGDTRPDRIVWSDRKWEWAALRFENGDFETPNYTDNYARDKWFYQAIGVSPAMFKRDPTAGSLYWLGLRDNAGAPLDGAKTYKLTVPQPVPNKLFWSVTVYGTDTRSQIQTDQGFAALRSLFEVKDLIGKGPIDLYFGPKAPAGKEKQWIKTIPGKGWFVYFRIYGPEKAAFDGSWKPGDFEEVK